MIKQPLPILIQDVMSDVVDAVNDDLLTYLKEQDSEITKVHFQFGTGYEIIETLQQISEVNPFEKYPLVAMFLDVKEVMNEERGIYSRIPILRMAIVCTTDQNYKAAERDLKTFKPILIPIYQSLLHHMSIICAFFKPGNGFEHEMTRNYFWGRQGLYGKEGNVFNDKCDAIELEFRDLKILSTYCPKPCGQQLANVGS